MIRGGASPTPCSAILCIRLLGQEVTTNSAADAGGDRIDGSGSVSNHPQSRPTPLFASGDRNRVASHGIRPATAGSALVRAVLSGGDSDNVINVEFETGYRISPDWWQRHDGQVRPDRVVGRGAATTSS